MENTAARSLPNAAVVAAAANRSAAGAAGNCRANRAVPAVIHVPARTRVVPAPAVGANNRNHQLPSSLSLEVDSALKALERQRRRQMDGFIRAGGLLSLGLAGYSAIGYLLLVKDAE
mmetsp:Transcript_22361/g.48618  ORF Transcript_22361/g.48618 Transcript_22361/m.48618 type:complete len:117 (+) Transcript_22361:421-771(+)